jgi:hypothetical protein
VAFAKAIANAGVSPSAPSLLIFDQLLTPKQILMTANSEVIYAFSVLDLSKAGPVVIEAPAGIWGGIVDFWQRAVMDIGIGPSASGGKFLLLPPDYAGDVPTGYTAQVWLGTSDFALLAVRYALMDNSAEELAAGTRTNAATGFPRPMGPFASPSASMAQWAH